MSEYTQANLPSQTVVVTENVQATVINTEDTSRRLALTIAQAAADRKAGDILVLRVEEVSYLADYFVMGTGYSRVQVRAIAQAIKGSVEIELNRRPLRSEGESDGSWVLLDYGDAIVHIMMHREREFYNLEAFWGHAETVEFSLANIDEEKPK